jgi:hypothetical protein
MVNTWSRDREVVWVAWVPELGKACAERGPQHHPDRVVLRTRDIDRITGAASTAP